MKDRDSNPIQRHHSRECLQPGYSGPRENAFFSIFITLALTGIIALSVFFFLGVNHQIFQEILDEFADTKNNQSKEQNPLIKKNRQVSNEVKVADSAAPLNKKELLFIGNSLTYQHNVYQQVCNILNARINKKNLKRNNKVDVYLCYQRTKGGYWLGHHLREMTTYNKKQRKYLLNKEFKKDWSWVILQEQSMAPGVDRQSDEFKFYRRNLVRFAKVFNERNTKLGLFKTWAHKDGHKDIQFKKRFSSYKKMSEHLEEGFQTGVLSLMKNDIDINPFPVGKAFSIVKKNSNKDFKNLYAGDRHASINGASLAAYVIALGILKNESEISSKNWQSISIKSKISKRKAEVLKRVAWEAYR